jgi:twitching motility protein PilT
MRDLETISTAVTAAETGHLVFATLHTQDAPQTIDRIIDAFPPHQQQQIRVQLSTTLQGVVTQAMQAGARYGMRTMDQALAYLVTNGKISMDLAKQRCHDPQELERMTTGGTGVMGNG